MESNERKIYPLTKDIIDKAEENTVNNFDRYFEAEMLRREIKNMSVEDFANLSEETAKEYCEKIAFFDLWEASLIKGALSEGKTYLQIAGNYRTK